MISQLVDNGIKFTPAGGTVTLRAGGVSDRVWITVEDTGIGIPASRLNELFEPFHQLDGSMHPPSGRNRAWGCNLCKQIVEAHGSQITLQSKEGSGSTFLFDLPIARSCGNQTIRPARRIHENLRKFEEAGGRSFFLRMRTLGVCEAMMKGGRNPMAVSNSPQALTK